MATSRPARARPPTAQTGSKPDPACVLSPVIGLYHPRARGNPYKVCLSDTQLRTLFPASNTRGWDWPGKSLGGGVFARVWAQSRNKVVKITNDQTDILSLKRANAAGVKGIPKLFNVYRLGTKTTSPQPVYAAVVERLSTQIPGRANVSCIADLGTADAELCCGKLRDDMSPERRERVEVCHRMAKDITKTISQLDKIGIPMTDLHEDNIGRDAKGKWKIIDLGLSAQVSTGKVAPTLQGAKNRRR